MAYTDRIPIEGLTDFKYERRTNGQRMLEDLAKKGGYITEVKDFSDDNINRLISQDNLIAVNGVYLTRVIDD